MTISADIWQARAAMCELLALSFRYGDSDVLAQAVVSGEWVDAAQEIADVLGIAWNYDTAIGAGEVTQETDAVGFLKTLRPEATRLFVGAPRAACSPYEGIVRSEAEGSEALMFANPHAMAVERFCKACGLGRPEGTHEPLDALWTELELLGYLASRAAEDAIDNDEDELASFFVASTDLPGGSPQAAYDEFMNEHAKIWMPQFAKVLQRESRIPFYQVAAGLLGAFVA